MVKLLKLVLAIIVVSGLGYYAFYLSERSKVSDDLSLIDFAVKDTSAVDKIEIFDTYTNESFTVKRNENGIWVDKNNDCVQQQIVHTMLETFYKITLKGYVPESAMENMKKLMLSKHKTVKIYKNGKWAKTWYVGHSTADHYGTHMLLETPKRKSDNPVIMGMKGFYGILEPRFNTDPKMFRCSRMFSYTRDELKYIQVENNVSPDENFEITIENNEVKVTENGVPLTNVSKEDLNFYLNGFQTIHFNQPNYTLTEKEMEEMRQATPDFKLTIKTKTEDYELSLHRRADPDVPQTGDEIEWDPDYLWGILPSGEVVRMQYYVIGPLIFGRDIFLD